MGRYGGGISSIRADDLAAIPLTALMERNPSVDWEALDDVLMGCANQSGEDNRNVARMAALLAGLPVTVPGATINRLCGSGLDALGTAGRAIKSGEAQLAIAGGVESMSRAPFVMGKATTAFSRDAQLRLRKHIQQVGRQFPEPQLHEVCSQVWVAHRGAGTRRKRFLHRLALGPGRLHTKHALLLQATSLAQKVVQDQQSRWYGAVTAHQPGHRRREHGGHAQTTHARWHARATRH